MRKNRKKAVFLIVGILVGIIVIGIVLMSIVSANFEKKMDNMVIEEVNLDTVSDGEYEGQFSAFPISVQVRVKVMDHTIGEIKIVKHQNGQGQDADNITETVIKEQSLKVDAVSGATYSSKAILKAIEDAFKSR